MNTKITFVALIIVCCWFFESRPALSATSTQNSKAETKSRAAKPDFGEAIEGMQKKEGLFTVFLNKEDNRTLLVLPPPHPVTRISSRIIHVTGISGGVGNAYVDTNLGVVSEPLILRFKIIGNVYQILAELPYTDGKKKLPDSTPALTRTFEHDVIWSGEIESRAKDGSALIDISGFLTGKVANRVESASGLGSGEPSRDLSLLDAAATLVFPDNIEFDAVLTYDADGIFLSDPVTISAHHSFIRLPDDEFKPRLADPRAGVLSLEVKDFAAPIDQPIQRNYVYRFRLKRGDPKPTLSTPENQIVYYVDRTAPEDVQKAIIEGAGWWNNAFEAAGYKDALRVEVLPEGIHPLDARYNVILWIERDAHGPSLGHPIVDPRTGEIIKSLVVLDALDARSDRLVFESLLPNRGAGTGLTPTELALQRTREIAAHEVGHSLGLDHNMAASSYDGRASVMDYLPIVVGRTADGAFDFSRAFMTDIGSWDKLVIQYLYTEFSDDENEAVKLNELMQQARAQGHVYVNDMHAVLGVHAAASTWDYGSDPVSSLNGVLSIREKALNSLGLGNLRPNQPTGDLSQHLSILYQYHMGQVRAASHLIGGLSFTYSLQSEENVRIETVAPDDQRRALMAILQVLDPAWLLLPDHLLTSITPKNGITWADPIYTAPDLSSNLDPMIEETAFAGRVVRATLSALLSGDRLARVSLMHTRDGKQLSVSEILQTLSANIMTFSSRENARISAIREEIAYIYVELLGEEMRGKNISPSIKRELERHLSDLQSKLSRNRTNEKEKALSRRIGLILRPPLLVENTGGSFAPRRRRPPKPVAGRTCRTQGMSHWHRLVTYRQFQTAASSPRSVD